MWTPLRSTQCVRLAFVLASLASQWLVACAPAQAPPATESSADGPVRLERLRTFHVLNGGVHAAAFSPDGAVLVTTGEVGDVRALELATGKVLWQNTPGDHWSGVVAFSADGSRVACCGRHLTIHDMRTGEVMLRREHTGPRGFVWRRDGRGFAYANGEKVLVHTYGKSERVRATFEYPVQAIAEAEDGGLFVGDNVGRTWRLPPDGGAAQLHRDRRAGRGHSMDSVALVSAGGTLFDVASAGPVYRGGVSLEVPGSVYAFAVSVDGEAFAVGGGPPVVRWWRGGGRESRDLDTGASVVGLALHPDGGRLFCATSDGMLVIRSWDGARQDVPAHPARVSEWAMSPDGSMLAIRGTAWQLQPVAGGPARPLPNARQVVAGRRGSELIVVESDRVVVLEPHGRRELAVVGTSTSWLNRLSIAPGPGETLLMGERFVDLATDRASGKCEALLLASSTVTDRNPQRWCAGTGFGIEGEFGALVLTDARGELIGSCDGEPVYAVSFSPDGRKLFYGCGTGLSSGMGPPGRRLRVRDANTFQLLRDLDACVYGWWFLDPDHALALGRDGLELWDVPRLAPVQLVKFDGRDVRGRCVPDARMLVHCTGADVEVYRVHFTPAKK